MATKTFTNVSGVNDLRQCHPADISFKKANMPNLEIKQKPFGPTTICLDDATIIVDHFTDLEQERQLARAIADFLLARMILAGKPNPEPEDIICDRCNGSGEGMTDGSRCAECKGRGVLMALARMRRGDDAIRLRD